MKSKLPYDQYRQGVEEAKCADPVGVAIARIGFLELAVQLATRWKDPCLFGYPWVKSVFASLQFPGCGGRRFDPSDVNYITYKWTLLCKRSVEWLEATTNARVNFARMFGPEFAEAERRLREIVAELPENWIEDDNYMKAGAWRHFFAEEGGGRYRPLTDLAKLLHDAFPEMPYDETVRLHMAEDDGRFESALFGLRALRATLCEITAALRKREPGAFRYFLPDTVRIILSPYAPLSLTCMAPPEGIGYPIDFAHKMHDEADASRQNWEDLVQALLFAAPESPVLLKIDTALMTFLQSYDLIFALLTPSPPTGEDAREYQRQLDRLTDILIEAGAALRDREVNGPPVRKVDLTDKALGRIAEIVADGFGLKWEGKDPLKDKDAAKGYVEWLGEAVRQKFPEFRNNIQAANYIFKTATEKQPYYLECLTARNVAKIRGWKTLATRAQMLKKSAKLTRTSEQAKAKARKKKAKKAKDLAACARNGG